MTPITISPAMTSGTPSSTSQLVATAASSSKLSRVIPTFIAADEAYYWSRPWQADVRKAMAARAAGESVVFDSDDPNDVIRWLLDGDDED